MSTLGQLIAGIAREINTPLGDLHLQNPDNVSDMILGLGLHDSIGHWKNFLQSENALLKLEYFHRIVRIFSNAKNIDNAVDKASKIVFTLTNYSHRGISGEKLPVNLEDSLETVLIIYKGLLKNGIEIKKDYHFNGEVMGYPDELSQVWTNLIHNAVQSMDKKGEIRIQMDKEETSGFVIVSVSDSGRGIPREIQSKIFDPFFTTKASGEGTGLGLGIVKKIVEKHCGEINFLSEVGKGSVFTVRLPI
ncbi:MAG: HAMP domain-containing histidine kinase [Leptospira sp.]|nr:HAMP domain-containing histidine kinase [Leptospira sp.]